MITSFKEEFILWSHYTKDVIVYKEHKPKVSFSSIIRFFWKYRECIQPKHNLSGFYCGWSLTNSYYL